MSTVRVRHGSISENATSIRHRGETRDRCSAEAVRHMRQSLLSIVLDWVRGAGARLQSATRPNPAGGHAKPTDAGILDAATAILTGGTKKAWPARLLPFLGPAFIASVAYMDPGNFATNIQAGAQFGYALLWVVVISNLMGMLIQALSAKLGIATGMNLAEQCRKHFPPPVAWFMWALMEIVAMATDLAEFLGAALAFNLLLGIPLTVAAFLTAVVTFLILGLERYGFRPLERVMTAFATVVAVSYLIEIFLVRPEWKRLLYHAVVPQMPGREAVLLAAGILGATVMPHAIFLHSALTQDRIVTRDPKLMRLLFRYEVADVLFAMGVAGAINAAILIMAASTFHASGMPEVGTIEEAHRTLTPLLGSASAIVFAISLLASGLSSSSVGTMAGQVIMQGFIHRRIPVWLRRMVTILPSLAVITLGADPTRSMVISQVILSFGLPFALVPLILFTSSRKIMGALTNHGITTALMCVSAALVVALNVYLLYRTFF
jgi:manganese transport protein